MKCNTEGCGNFTRLECGYCSSCELEWELGLTDNICPQCDDITDEGNGSWCESCRDDVDLDEHEERKRQLLTEAQEY